MIERFKLDNKGVISIPGALMAFAFLLVITFFVHFMFFFTGVGQMQGVLDDAGTGALRAGVDENTLFSQEELVLDHARVEAKFRDMVYKHMGRAGGIKNFRVENVRIYTPDEARDAGLSSQHGKDTYFIESVGTAIFDTATVTDTVALRAVQYFDFFDGTSPNTISRVEHRGRTKDGKAELIVRSVSRIALR